MSDTSGISLCLIGAGNMGGALLHGWLSKGTLEGRPPIVIEPNPSEAIASLDEKGLIELNPSSLHEIDVALVAVKPQVMADVLKAHPFLHGTEALVVSVAAGTQIEAIKSVLGEGVAVVRAMPNTPAAIGLGMTVATASQEVREEQRNEAQRLLSAVGKVAWVDRESDLNAVTAVSGSGPAYVFLLIEALAYAAKEEGLADELAQQLALETVRGAGVLAALADEDVATLRKNVTSPGGTTAAALDVLMGEGGLSPLMRTAVKAATQRAKDLG